MKDIKWSVVWVNQKDSTIMGVDLFNYYECAQESIRNLEQEVLEIKKYGLKVLLYDDKAEAFDGSEIVYRWTIEPAYICYEDIDWDYLA